MQETPEASFIKYGSVLTEELSFETNCGRRTSDDGKPDDPKNLPWACSGESKSVEVDIFR